MQVTGGAIGFFGGAFNSALRGELGEWFYPVLVIVLLAAFLFLMTLVRRVYLMKEKYPITGLLIAVALTTLVIALSGCAQMFAAKTSARYVIHPDGTREIFYESDKEQVGLDASVDKNGLIHVKVDKAGTQESVVAAALQQQIMMGKLLEQLMPLIQKAGAMGAGS